MRIFDPHIHMTSRTTDDYEAMYAAGVRAVVEPAFWLGQPRTSPESFYDYFDSLLGWEPYRAAQFGIQHFCTIALNLWGPNAGMPSTQWILGAARQVFDEHDPDLTLVYIPQMDYEPQRSGPDSAATARAARRLDDALRPLIDHFLAAGATVVALSEYGITPVSRPVDINRALRRAGLLDVYTQDGMEYLDPWTPGPRAPSPSPTTRWHTSTCAIPGTSPRSPRSSANSTASTRSWTRRAKRRTA
ncbi:alkaline phosphatase family protein [Streptomyces sp. NPDC058678]|uniref:alkaline phosphatase family protein n=1 Tax=Streptomyces sp. NPDC058678 TaxID=3346595 RepID=UPI00364EDD0B